MGKVVTSGGLNEFISSGKHEEIKADPKPKPVKEAPPLEVVKTSDPLSAQVQEVKPPPDEEYKDDDPETQAALEKDEKARKAINRKHKEAMSFKALAEKRAAELSDAEEFAKGQWNEKRLSDERAAQLEKELADLKKGATPVVQKSEKGKPDPKVFVDDKGQFKSFEYAEALAEWAATKAVEDDRAKQVQERRQNEAAQAEALARQRVAETEKRHPDFKEVVAAADVRTHNDVIAFLSANEHIGEVSYYLAKNPEYLARINAMHPYAAIAELGELIATQFKKPPKATGDKPLAEVVTSTAPPPIKTLSSAGTVNTNVDPAKMSYRELRAYERERRRRA
jgi:hypothetical protein